MKIGFIGLGNMGRGMAHSLLKAGHSLIVFNRTRKKTEALEKEGAKVADSISGACQADVVITMLSDDGAVEQTVFGKEGILSHLPPAAIHVSMSTIGPALAGRLDTEHRKHKQGFLSAPVLGRPEAAEQAKLFILVGGDEKVRARCLPLFAEMGQRTFIIGPAPQGANLVKISCNLLIAAILDSVGETLALVKKSGTVEASQLVEVLMSTVLGSPVFRPYEQNILNGNFKPGFRIPLALKDIELVVGAGKQFVVPTPIASLLRDHLLEAIALGYGDLDWSALTLVAQKEAGVKSAA